MENAKTLTGSFVNGLLKLKKAGFSEEDIDSISTETSEFMEQLLLYYDHIDFRFQEFAKNSLDEWFDGIIALRKAGYSTDDVMNYMGDIKNAYYYIENDDLYDEDDDEDYYDDFDDDDDDEDDNDNDFDPRKFFPRK
jgi:hypothetical protein